MPRRTSEIPIDPGPYDPRHVVLQHAFNTRDLGGLIGLDGRALRKGRLYRSDSLHLMSGDDLQQLESLGVRTVLDLRTEYELELAGERAPSGGIDLHHLPLLREPWARPVTELVGDAAAIEFLVERYADILVEGAESLRVGMDHMANEASHAVLFHCTLGKDRTGVLAMLVLSLLGVSDDDIADDYHLTRHGTERWLDWAGDSHPGQATAMSNQPRAFLIAPRAVPLRALVEMRDRYGSVDAYIRGIGVAPPTIQQLRECLLEDPDDGESPGNGSTLTSESKLLR